MTDVRNLLDEVIEGELANLRNLPSDDENRSEAIKNLAALHKLRIDEVKVKMEAEEKREQREREDIERERDAQFKKRQLRGLAADRYVKLGIAAAELVLPLMFYGVWMREGFKFEETGTYTSQTFKNLFNRFKPTKKG